MRTDLYSDGMKLPVELETQGDSDLVWVAGRQFKVSVLGRVGNRIRVQVDGKPFEVVFEREGFASTQLSFLGDRFAYSRAEAPAVHAAAGPNLLSPLPGRIIGVHARAGSKVKVGDSLFVIESMKMETVLRSDRDGVVRAIGVKEGEIVARGRVLVTFS